MNIAEKKEFRIRVVCVIVVAIVSGLMAKTMYEGKINEKKIPLAARWNYIEFHEELTEHARINKIDVTEEYIYILYSGFGVIAVYDWSGTYQFSMVFFTDTNGAMEMRCDQELLYVSDHDHVEYVFSGNSLIRKVQPTDYENQHASAWFDDTTPRSYIIKDHSIYLETGDFVMKLPGKYAEYTIQPFVNIALILFMLVCLVKRRAGNRG